MVTLVDVGRNVDRKGEESSSLAVPEAQCGPMDGLGG